jgi:hypothetical protein
LLKFEAALWPQLRRRNLLPDRVADVARDLLADLPAVSGLAVLADHDLALGFGNCLAPSGVMQPDIVPEKIMRTSSKQNVLIKITTIFEF